MGELLSIKRTWVGFLFIAVMGLSACSAPVPTTQAALQYENKLVRKPGSTPEDTKVYVVREGRRHWIVNGAWITKNNYRWPDDVKTISATDLEAIPMGEPIP